MEKEFCFTIARKKALAESLGVEQELSISLSLTQDQFEDYQYLKDKVREALRSIGIPDSEDVLWRESPPVPDGFIPKLRDALQAGSQAEFIPYYPHSFHYRTYKEVVIDGVRYLWMSFQNGKFIQFAPSLANPA